MNKKITARKWGKAIYHALPQKKGKFVRCMNFAKFYLSYKWMSRDEIGKLFPEYECEDNIRWSYDDQDYEVDHHETYMGVEIWPLFPN